VLGFQAGAQPPLPDEGVGEALGEGDLLGDELGEAEGEAPAEADADAEGVPPGGVPPYGFAITVSVRFCTPQPFAWVPGSHTSTVSFWIQVPMSIATQSPYPGMLK
jgi:hypothetical protein